MRRAVANYVDSERPVTPNLAVVLNYNVFDCDWRSRRPIHGATDENC